MVECPMCHHRWDKEADNYIKIRKKVIQELIEFLEQERGEKKDE